MFVNAKENTTHIDQIVHVANQQVSQDARFVQIAERYHVLDALHR